jgi:hypothetical protein
MTRGEMTQLTEFCVNQKASSHTKGLHCHLPVVLYRKGSVLPDSHFRREAIHPILNRNFNVTISDF